METTSVIETVKKRSMWRNVLLFLAVLGPGIITANVDNDAGGIATYSVAGAAFGYSLLWAMLPVTLALVVIQEMSARMGAVTGKGLADLIRENYGVKLTFYTMIALLVTNIGNTIAEFAGIAASLEIFNIQSIVSVPLSALFVWLVIVRGSYKAVEKVFLIACLVYIAYPISGYLAKPNWHEVWEHTIHPTFTWGGAAVLMVVGIVGTTIAPWMQFYLQSAVVEKEITADEYAHSRLDVIIGCVFAAIVAIFIMVACGATIFKAGVTIHDAKDAAIALQPLAGKYASMLFSFGLFNASLFAASILPLSTAYTVCEGLGWEAGVNKTFSEAPQFYALFTAILAIGALAVLIPNFPLFRVMVISQVINGVLLPVILIFMIFLINKSELMGKYVNSRFYNGVCWLTVAIMIALTVILTLYAVIHPDQLTF